MEIRPSAHRQPAQPTILSVSASRISNWMACTPLDSVQWFQTTKRLATTGFPSFEADVSNIGPPGCQRQDKASKGMPLVSRIALDAEENIVIWGGVKKRRI